MNERYVAWRDQGGCLIFDQSSFLMAKSFELAALICIASVIPASAFSPSPNSIWLKSPQFLSIRKCQTACSTSKGLLAASMNHQASLLARQVTWPALFFAAYASFVRLELQCCELEVAVAFGPGACGDFVYIGGMSGNIRPCPFVSASSCDPPCFDQDVSSTFFLLSLAYTCVGAFYDTVVFLMR